MTATVTNIIDERIKRLDLDLDRQIDMWKKAVVTMQPSRELFNVMKETEREIDLLEESVL